MSKPTWLHGDGTWRFATSPSSGIQPFKLLAGQCLIAEVSPCPTVGSGWDDESILQLIEAAPALLAALAGLLAQVTGPVMVHGDGIGYDGTKTGLSGDEFNALRDSRISQARNLLSQLAP